MMETRHETKKQQEDVNMFGMKVCSDEASAHSSETNVLQESPEITQDLALYISFKYLPVEDLISSQFVCPQWHRVVQDPDLWKNKTLILDKTLIDNNMYKWKLVNGPFIQNIAIHNPPSLTHYKDTANLVETIILHQRDLRSFEANCFYTDLLHKLVTKFNNLRSITIGVAHEQVIETLQVLKLCKELKQLNFIYPDCVAYDSDPDETDEIVEMLGDCFTSLTDLDLSYFQSFLSTNDVKYILERKISHLKRLKLTCKDDIVNSVSQSSDLELFLVIYYYSRRFKLSTLQNLKSLKIAFGSDDFSYVNRLLENTVMPNVDHFEIYCKAWAKYCEHEFVPLKTVVASFPNTKSILIKNLDECSLNGKLAHLSALPKLKEIQIINAGELTDDGYLHLAKCQSLELLKIDYVRVNSYEVHALSKCSTLRRLELNHVWAIDTKGILLLVTSLSKLRSLKLSVSNFDKSEIEVSTIKQKCESLNIFFTIKNAST